MEASEGQILAGKYRIEQVLGRGGMGVVVAAHHLVLDEPVAIKFLLPEALGNGEAVARFEREARAAVKIKSEHVARVSDVGKLDSGAPYMVMELMRGCDLAELLRQNGPLPIADVADFVLQAGEAIAEAHGLGIIHRDLKPQNLFLTKRADGSPCVKVLDFGISKMVVSGSAQAMTATMATMGSPLYMSPEQLMSARDVDMRADVWSLGVICFELLSARTPFTAETLPQLCMAVTSSAPIALRSLRPEVPPALESLIERCLEKDPRQRVASVAALACELVKFAPAGSLLSAQRIERTARAAGHRPNTNLSPLEASPPSPSNAAVAPIGGSDAPTVSDFGRTKHGSAQNRRTRLAVGFLAASVAAGGWLWWRRSPSVPPPSVVASERPIARAEPVAPPLTAAAVAPALAASNGESGTAAVSGTSSAAPLVAQTSVLGTQRGPRGAPARAVARETVSAATPPPAAPPAIVAPPPASRPALDCDIPYTFDARGNKVFKKGCL